MRGIGIPNPMFFIGVVENNDDRQFQGRVQVRAFGVHGTHANIPTQDLPWAICVSGHYDPNSPIPPINSFVFGIFTDGDEAQHPMILGMIPTQYVEEMFPTADGYGVIPVKNGEVAPLLAKGFTPEDIGHHQRSKLARAEDVGKTFHKQVSANVKRNQDIAGREEKWEQPPSAYSTVYPYNQVIETSHHTIELDDTPGGERIMIHHKTGSFIQIDAKGTTTERAEGDRYEINIGTKHESSSGSIITINGDAFVKVNGNKTEEVTGNYKLIVGGTTDIGSGANLFLNTGDGVNIRGSTVKVEANTDTLTLFGKKQIKIEAEQQINNVSNHIKNNALQDFNVYASKGIKLTSPMDFHLQASNGLMTFTGLVPPSPKDTPTSLASGTIGVPTSAGLSISAPTVNMVAANGSFTGLWNATGMSTGILTATVSVNTKLVNATAVQATKVGGTRGDFATLGAPLPISSSPGSPCSPGPGRVTPSTIPNVSIPTVPILNVPAISNPAPPLFPMASGMAYPKGNGDLFLAQVLTSPFTAFFGGIIPPLLGSGYGMEMIKAPEPPAKNMSIQKDPFVNRKGHVPGTFNTNLED